MSILKQRYREHSLVELQQQFELKSVMQVPRIVKITLNMGIGEATRDKNALESAKRDMRSISAQQPVSTLARKSIAGFKIREGWPIGCKVTLREQRMWDFLDRLVFIAIPRIRDFRGLNPKSFDGRGNFSMGVNEQIIFPEIDFDKIDRVRGLDICVTTTAPNDAMALALLRSLQFPFKGS